MRKVDDLGRIVIPMELRKKYGLSKGVEIEFLDNGDGITVKALRAVLQNLSRRDPHRRSSPPVRRMYRGRADAPSRKRVPPITEYNRF